MPMTPLRAWLARIRGLFGNARSDKELAAEMQAHLDALADKYVRRGMTPDEARHAARREFGGVEQTREAYREQRGLPFLDTLAQDLRFTFRGLAARPGFAAIAVLTLAFGIGATTAVFSVVDRTLFRSLPYAEENRLVSFGLLAPIEPEEFMLGANYVDFRREAGPFESIAAMAPGTLDCDITEENPVRLSCAQVEQTFLPTFGVQPVIGRNFSVEEDRPQAPRVALMSYPLWKSRFGSNPAVLGRTMSLDGKPARIVGVLPANFEMPTLEPVDLLVPRALDEAEQRRSVPGSVLRTFARLKPGIDLRGATAGLQPWFERSLMGAPPEFRKEIHLSLRGLRERQTANARMASWILLGAVLAVLLVACANVANLLLVRAVGREREFAVRAAVGASRGRLVRQALTESLVLALFGGLAGCWVAALLLRLLVVIAPEGLPRLQQAGVDVRVSIFALGVALVSAALFGIAPALHLPPPELLTGRQTHARTRNVLQQILVSAQIAVSFVLLACAGLLLRSLWNVQNTPTGMNTENVVTEEVSLPAYRYPGPAQQVAFFLELEKRLKGLPGVTLLALSDSLPPAGAMRSTIFAAIEVEGRAPLREGTGGTVPWRAVTPDYFSALSVPIVEGRGFRPEDRQPSENPIVLNQTLVRALFPNEDPIGRHLRLFRMEGPWRTVVGVAANVKNNGVTEKSEPEFYLPWKNDPVIALQSAHVIARTRMGSSAMAAWMRTETAGFDATIPVTVELMSQRVGKLAEGARFRAVLLSLFAATGVALAAIGIYGVVGFLVAQQTREIGVRMALGANASEILRMVLANVARWTVAGAALGLIGAWFGARLLESMLYEVRAHDPLLFGVALLILLATPFVAACVPARRAIRVNPVVALRSD